MDFPTGHNKTPTWQAAPGPTPVEVAKPKPMSADELAAPAPTQSQLKEQLRRVLNHVVSPEKLQHLVFTLYDRARNGDKFALEILFGLLSGARDKGTEVEPLDAHIKPRSRKQVEEELARLGWTRQDPKQSDSPTV